MPSELDQPWESAASSVPMVHGSACVKEMRIIKMKQVFSFVINPQKYTVKIR